MPKTKSGVTQITLKKDDAALVIRNSKELEIIFPNEDDTVVNDGALAVSIIGILMSEGNPTLGNLMKKKTAEMMKVQQKYSKSEKEKKVHGGKKKKTATGRIRK